MAAKPYTIIGIDPGSRCTGYAIVSVTGTVQQSIAFGEIKTQDTDLNHRLWEIYDKLSHLISTHQPEEAAVEQVFTLYNHQSALKLGQARGAALVATAHHGLTVSEYSPKQVKQAVVGYGNADKKQVQHMIRLLLKIKGPLSADAADALAIALCHANHKRLSTKLEETKVI